MADGVVSDSVVIRRVDAFAFRHPIAKPVATSFGIMTDRPAVFVRLEAEDGSFGWGEVFANWPAAGAEHRANLVVRDFGDLVLGARLDAPSDLLHALTKATRIRAIQCGEFGPFRQVIAGLDIAAWDLFARRAGLPVRLLLNSAAADRVPTYASGIAVTAAAADIEQARAQGGGAFKVKVGFDADKDADQVAELASGLASGEQLFTDANQAWDVATALSFVDRLAGRGVGWLEEPLPVDAPAAAWSALAQSSGVPLAGGENIAGSDNFSAAISAGALAVLQPDVAKWGGFSGCFEVARTALDAGRRYCPHFLGGGIGLLASAHLLAAAGGDGLLEVDVNPNPLRDAIAPTNETVRDGVWHFGEAVGLGIDELPPDLEKLKTFGGGTRQ